jgi:predicted transposase/invertase (TIGR01784 family)
MVADDTPNGGLMMLRIGIRPTNDFAFKKTFGSPGNTLALISLLNAILNLPVPIVEVTVQNPFNPQDFQDDKLSVLDIRAVDQRGAIYDIEMQLSASPGLTKRIVFYGCEVYAGQMRSGDQYHELKPVYSICLLDGQVWADSTKVHHAFRLTDRDTGRCLTDTLEVHTLELGGYTLQESDLSTASTLDRWLFWLLHAHEYDEETLKRLFPDPAFWQATDTIARIARITEDKTMYDTREKAIRDQQWLLNSAREEGEKLGEIRGKISGEINIIQTLQEIFGVPVSDEASLRSQSLDQLRLMTAELRGRIQNRPSVSAADVSAKEGSEQQ